MLELFTRIDQPTDRHDGTPSTQIAYLNQLGKGVIPWALLVYASHKNWLLSLDS